MSFTIDPGVQSKYLDGLAVKLQDRQGQLADAEAQLAVLQLEEAALSSIPVDAAAALLGGSVGITSGANIAELKGTVDRLQSEVHAIAAYQQAVQAIPATVSQQP